MRDRYPNEDIARFDQQFAEDDDERKERLRRSRLIAQLDRTDPLWRIKAESIRKYGAA